MNKQKPGKDVDIVQVTSSWRGGQHRVGRKPCLEFISSSVTKSAAVTVGKSGWKKYAQPSEYSSDTLSGEQQTEVWPKNPPVNGKPPTSEPLMTTSQSLDHSISQVIYMHQSIIRHKYQTLQLWNRLMKMSDYRLPKIYIYIIGTSLMVIPGQKSWNPWSIWTTSRQDVPHVLKKEKSVDIGSNMSKDFTPTVS